MKKRGMVFFWGERYRKIIAFNETGENRGMVFFGERYRKIIAFNETGEKTYRGV